MSQLITTSTKIGFFVVFVALWPPQSIQQNINSHLQLLSIIDATCEYSYDSKDIYTCKLNVTAPVSSSDVLEITGIHIENHTDADVEAVSYAINVDTFFNGEVLKKFVNLKRISMSGHNLLGINPGAFDVCLKLEALNINYGELTSFPSGLLKNCENLKSFEVMATKVETIPENFFGGSKNLEEFFVAVNQLTSLPEMLLQNMEKLSKFNIGYNKLTQLSPNFLINAPNLEEVFANDNQFREQEDITYALNGRMNLKYLWIEGNNYTNFDFRFFAQFQNLEKLWISLDFSYKLTGISWHSLPVSLIQLSVEGIGEEIPENAFNRLVNLNSLTLSGTAIKNFHKDIFKPLTSLKFLHLYDTGLKTLHPELFISQINLRNLIIRHSDLEELPPGIFVPFANIGIDGYGIQITATNLQRLNANSFGKHPNLHNINFSFNKINEIERGIFSKFHSKMTFAGFFFNTCVSKYLEGENLDNNEELEDCFVNWIEIDPNNRTTTTRRATPTTTSGASGRNFKKFEVIVIIFVGIFSKVLLKIVI